MFGNKENSKEIEESRESTNIIGKGTSVIGDINSTGAIRIESGGKIDGNVNTRSKIFMGPGSEVNGNVLAVNAEISGHIKGIIKIEDMLILKSSTIIEGDIQTKKLTIEPGAVFNGSCVMTSSNKAHSNGQHAKKEAVVK